MDLMWKKTLGLGNQHNIEKSPEMSHFLVPKEKMGTKIEILYCDDEFFQSSPSI